MVNFGRNNMDKALSPYLKQHKDNPIYWQEWSSEVLEYAKKNRKLILVSVGYATCHWCHVMASEAFSDKEIANYLNQYFVAIKVDREQRPDIDHYMMSFIQQTQGSGGWPLNVILTPDTKPIFAVTYAPITPRYGMPSFLHILKQAKELFEIHGNKINQFIPEQKHVQHVEEDFLIHTILSSYDAIWGGFQTPKFPPHCTLLFLLSYYEQSKNHVIKEVIEKTLDNMAKRGLHDHLQGGFFRYCVDESWEIPHFEKMLYDQAMLLWGYSVAFKVLKKKEYKIIADKIIQCLQETFEIDGLFYSGHDADTEHHEGKTYVWTKEELQKNLTKKEFEDFAKVYTIYDDGNFEGKNHLIKNKIEFLPEIEKKLLEIRKKRKQPFVDKKIITIWNCLLGIGFLFHYRCTNNNDSLEKLKNIFKKIIDKHYIDGKLYHSSLGNEVQKNEFLEDYAALLLFATYLYEDTNDNLEIIKDLLKKLNDFKKNSEMNNEENNGWIEHKNDDFQKIPAQDFDHPIPSSHSLAEFAVFRANLILGNEYDDGKYKHPLYFDFYNLLSFFKNGFLHIIKTPEKLLWEKLPFNCMQIRAAKIEDCYMMKCTEFKDVQNLLIFLNNLK